MKVIQKNNLISDIYNYDVILLIMGINNSMNTCFLKEVSVNFPDVKGIEALNRYGDMRKLGNVYTIKSKGITFCCCYAIKNNNVNIEYLRDCIKKVTELYKEKNIATTIETTEEILKLFNEVNTNITVYCDDGKDYNLYYYRRFHELKSRYKNGDISKEEYERIKIDLSWEQEHGIYTKRPDDWKPKKNDKFSFLKK